jgi:hypothetical protein
MDERLRAALVERFQALNGEHRMTPEDDAYVAEWYAPLDRIAADAGGDVDELARVVLAGGLSLPGYVDSSGTPMFTRDLLTLPGRAGGFEQLPAWFGAQYDDPATAVVHWTEYLSGQLVCLRRVDPETMRRKEELVEEIDQLLAVVDRDDEWLDTLHLRVDELDAIEPPFAPYDRLRFGGPVSRDRLIDDVRRAHPQPARA